MCHSTGWSRNRATLRFTRGLGTGLKLSASTPPDMTATWLVAC